MSLDYDGMLQQWLEDNPGWIPLPQESGTKLLASGRRGPCCQMGSRRPRFFTWGCNDLHIQTDHQPLVKLLGNRALDEIDNNQILSFKEKTMPWRFKIAYMPGCKIPAPDATSRRPDDRAEDDENESHFIAALNAMRVVDDIDHAEEDIIAAARSGLAQLHADTWERVRDETSRDIHMLQLMNMAKDGFPNTPQRMSPQLLGFWRFRDSLSAIDGVITYGNRTVIPPSLRSEVCQHLHSAH